MRPLIVLGNTKDGAVVDAWTILFPPFSSGFRMSFTVLSSRTAGSAGAGHPSSSFSRSRAERQTPTTLISKPRLADPVVSGTVDAARRRREVREALSDENAYFDVASYSRRRTDSVSSIETIRAGPTSCGARSTKSPPAAIDASSTHSDSCAMAVSPPMSPKSPLMDIVDASWPTPPKMTETIECSIMRRVAQMKPVPTKPVPPPPTPAANQNMGPVRPTRRTRTEPLRSGMDLAARPAKPPAPNRRLTDPVIEKQAVAFPFPIQTPPDLSAPIDIPTKRDPSPIPITRNPPTAPIVVPAKQVTPNEGRSSPSVLDLETTVVRIVLLSEHLTVWDCPEE